ncbi:EAL domain-containing protein [Oceanobacillus sp. CAU 1775]
MHCKSCSVNPVKYQIKFEGTQNLSMLAEVIEHLKRRNIEVEEKNNILIIHENGVRELYQYCVDHMEINEITFRMLREEWKAFVDVEKVLAIQWVDEIIKEELVHCLYQPIVKASREIYGFELLSRFKNKDGTVIYPNEMFQAAKERGRLYALDKLCRMTAVKHAAAIKADQKAFINFIPTSIYSPEHCLKSTIQTANEQNISPDQLVFEVVETEQVDDIEHLKRILSYYKDRGFEYALDDVGEGFSTLEVLEQITPTYMKLDMKYVQGVHDDPEKQRVAKHFLEKAREVASIPLAEGVEEQAEFEWLKAAGYELFQGYYFGKPAPTPLED